MTHSLHPERTRFLKFLAVGAISYLVDFGFLNLFTLVIRLPLLTAQALSFVLAVINSYILNHFWTYRDSRNKPVIQKFIQFALVNVVGIGIRTVLIHFLDRTLSLVLQKIDHPLLGFSDQVISQNLALAFAVLVVMMWNYFINRYWTFSDAHKELPFQPGLSNQDE